MSGPPQETSTSERQKLGSYLQEESPRRYSIGPPHEKTGERMRKAKESQGKYRR